MLPSLLWKRQFVRRIHNVWVSPIRGQNNKADWPAQPSPTNRQSVPITKPAGERSAPKQDKLRTQYIKPKTTSSGSQFRCPKPVEASLQKHRESLDRNAPHVTVAIHLKHRFGFQIHR
jgi:hypothetical protein